MIGEVLGLMMHVSYGTSVSQGPWEAASGLNW